LRLELQIQFCDKYIMWEFVDKVVYINLDYRTDRHISMEKFFEAGKIPQEKVVRFSAIQHEVGPVGAYMSHIAALKLAKSNAWNRVLILEDDVMWKNFENDYERLCKLIESQTWDVCMLGGVYIDTTPPKINASFSGYSYIVQSHYYDTLLLNMEEGLRKRFEFANGMRRISFRPTNKAEYLHRLKNNWYALDVYWMKLQLRDNWIGMIEPMCEHDFNSDSDVSPLRDLHLAPYEMAIVGMQIKQYIETGKLF